MGSDISNNSGPVVVGRREQAAGFGPNSGVVLELENLGQADGPNNLEEGKMGCLGATEIVSLVDINGPSSVSVNVVELKNLGQGICVGVGPSVLGQTRIALVDCPVVVGLILVQLARLWKMYKNLMGQKLCK